MKVLFTCGGTGGHINPALAVAKLLRTKAPDTEILFIGAKGEMEEDLVPRAGFPLQTVVISNFKRSLRPSALFGNLKTLFGIAGAVREAGRLIDAFSPDVIVGTGGYASYPALKSGEKKHIPIVIHESNAVPGLTTKMIADKADRILVCFEECRAQYRHPERVSVTGTPVSAEFLQAAQGKPEEHSESHPLIVSFWGSLGAREMNKKIARFMELECREDAYRHIHATGSYGWKWMPDYVTEHGVALQKHPNIDMREYIYDMPAVMAEADLVICRGGAGTIAEVAASQTPCIIVPSPNAAGNHQEKNARILEERGAAIVISEAECTGDRLYETATTLLSDTEKRNAMRKALAEAVIPDAAERIVSEICGAAQKKGG